MPVMQALEFEFEFKRSEDCVGDVWRASPEMVSGFALPGSGTGLLKLDLSVDSRELLGAALRWDTRACNEVCHIA